VEDETSFHTTAIDLVLETKPLLLFCSFPPFLSFLFILYPRLSFFPHTGRIYIVLTVFTITNVYIVQQINSLILNPELFAKLFAIPLGQAVSLLSPVSALTQSLLFSICPMLFRLLANIEGSATSMDKAEQKAIIFFWYFFIIARFMGQIIWDITVTYFDGCEYGLFWFTQNSCQAKHFASLSCSVTNAHNCFAFPIPGRLSRSIRYLAPPHFFNSYCRNRHQPGPLGTGTNRPNDPWSERSVIHSIF
jgi:hypothetical protein